MVSATLYLSSIAFNTVDRLRVVTLQSIYLEIYFKLLKCTKGVSHENNLKISSFRNASDPSSKKYSEK